MDTPYEPAPAPPPGPALLDDNESNMLDNFFTTMNTNHLMNDFWMHNQQRNGGAGAGNSKSVGSFGFDWSNELPPTFEGSTTSLSQPTFPSSNFDGNGGNLMQDNSNPSSDILAAASMLYQNGMHGTESDPVSRRQRQLSTQGMSGLNGTDPGLGVHEKQLHLDPSGGSPRARRPAGFHTSQMLFDTHEPVPVEQRSAKARTLHWGSDISFMDQGYIAPPDQPDVEEQTKDLLHNLQCLEPQNSTSNTRAPSPERTAGGRDATRRASGNGVLPGEPRSGYQGMMDEDLQPKKKQKTIIKEEDEESDEDSPMPKSRRSRGPGSIKSRRGSTDVLRKAKAQQGAKQSKENLSEEQKRNNHILSEQKRRNLIRQGFDDLCALVPGLRGGGFSKSAMLTQAADWLEDMIHGNEILSRQLAEMKSINGLVMPR